MASAEFSELYKHTGGLCQWSPDGTMLASGCGTTLAVRDSVTLNIIKMFTCIDTIDRIEWSFDSKLVLAVVRRRQAVEVWSIERENWTCRITEGIAGLVHGQWAADGRHILSIADFQLHMTVWSFRRLRRQGTCSKVLFLHFLQPQWPVRRRREQGELQGSHYDLFMLQASGRVSSNSIQRQGILQKSHGHQMVRRFVHETALCSTPFSSTRLTAN